MQIFSFVLLLWSIFSLVVIFQRRMNMLHFLGTTLTALETLRREINISVLTVRTGEKPNRHSFCHRKAVRERREKLLDSLTWATADCERNHIRELGDVVWLTWAQTPGAESQKHQAHQLDVQSCHHLSAFWQAGPDRETLKESSLSLSVLSLAFSWLWKWVNCERCSGHSLYIHGSRRMMSWLYRMCPAFISISPLSLHAPSSFPFVPHLIPPPRNLDWKCRSSLIAAVAQDFWLTERVAQRHCHIQQSKLPWWHFFFRFLSCPHSRNLSFWYLERWFF